MFKRMKTSVNQSTLILLFSSESELYFFLNRRVRKSETLVNYFGAAVAMTKHTNYEFTFLLNPWIIND